MRLFLVRHGQTPANVTETLDTSIPGPPLTELGQRQAAALPREFADIEIDRLWATTMIRSQQTAAPLAAERELGLGVLDNLREVDAGAVEGRNDDEARRMYRETVTAWLTGNLGARIPGGIDGNEFLARYDLGLAEVAATGARTSVVVSHGTAIRVWSGLRLQGISTEFAISTYVPNTGVVEIEGEPGDFRLVSWIERSANDPNSRPAASVERG